MRRSNPRRRGPGPSGPPPRDPPPSEDLPLVVVITGGVALYLACLWLGIVVIKDSPARSAVMAGLIVAIAAVGYVFTHPSPPRRR